MVKLEAFLSLERFPSLEKRAPVQTALSSQPIISPTLFFGLTPAPESLHCIVGVGPRVASSCRFVS